MDLRASTVAIAATGLLVVACGEAGGSAPPPEPDARHDGEGRLAAADLDRPQRGPAEEPLPAPDADAAAAEAADPGAPAGRQGDGASTPHPPTELSVEIDPPDGWERVEDPEVVDVGGNGPAVVYLNDQACHDGFCAHLHALVMGGPIGGLGDYHARSRTEIQEVLDAELLVERPVEVHGHPGYHVEYRAGGERELHYLQRYAVVDGDAVVVTFTAAVEALPRWRDDAEAMLDSIVVVEE